jgi:acetyltransferase
VVDALPKPSPIPVLTCWLGEPAAAEARRTFSAHRVPTYETPDDAVRAFTQLADYRRNQDLLLETPPADQSTAQPDRAAVRAIIDAALAEERRVLTEPQAKALLEAYGIPTARTEIAADPAGAAELSRKIEGPVALKILSPDIIHKSDVGGVRLNLETPEEVVEAARAMLDVIRARVPKARITGLVVEEMVRRPLAHELLVGIGEDAVFGPVLLFGQGGTATEVIRDRAIGLPPLNPILARDMIARTRIAALLGGYRDRPPVDLDAVARTLVLLSELTIDFPEIAELDINPLLADDRGVIALDARVVVRSAATLPADRLAIRPYPSELEHDVALESGLRCFIRPIRPEDEPRLVDMVNRSTEEDKRLRFLGHLRGFPHPMAARLSQIDYDREMALVALLPNRAAGAGEMIGVARLVADPDNDAAEFAVMVRSDMKGRGLGFRLMTELVDHARRRGLRRLFGTVLKENQTMLTMAAELGFTTMPVDDPDLVNVAIDL